MKTCCVAKIVHKQGQIKKKAAFNLHGAAWTVGGVTASLPGSHLAGQVDTTSTLISRPSASRQYQEGGLLAQLEQRLITLEINWEFI